MNYSRYSYEFPDATPIAERDATVRGDVRKQIVRIGLEVLEALDAWDSGDRQGAIIELHDVQQAKETATRLMKASKAELDDAKRVMITKNRERGYYL